MKQDISKGGPGSGQYDHHKLDLLKQHYNVEEKDGELHLQHKSGQDFPYRIKKTERGTYQLDKSHSERNYIKPQFKKLSEQYPVEQVYDKIIQQHNKTAKIPGMGSFKEIKDMNKADNFSPSLSDFDSNINPHLAKGFADQRSVKEVLTDNLAKGHIDQDTYDKSIATYDNLMKAKGEGSRGGHIIGHTKSGKPVYADKAADHKDHKDWSAQDHKEAADIHNNKAEKHADIVANIDTRRHESRLTGANHQALSRYHSSRATAHIAESSNIADAEHQASLSNDEKKIIADQKKKQLQHHNRMAHFHQNIADYIVSNYKEPTPEMGEALQYHRDKHVEHSKKYLE